MDLNRTQPSIGSRIQSLGPLVFSTVLGSLIALSTSSCQQSPTAGGSALSDSNALPQNGPFDITFSKETCVKFGNDVPEDFCSKNAKNDQCWIGEGSLLTVRVLYQATEIGQNAEKYLSFQVADGLTNSLLSSSRGQSSTSSIVACSRDLINEKMKTSKSVSFIWSDHLSKITDKDGKEIKLNEIDKPPARSLSSVFHLARNGILTSGFGPRWGRPHQGIDLAWLPGTPIYAYCNGQVEFAGSNDTYYGYGNIVVLKHDPGECNGVGFTRYAHNSSISVRIGEFVQAGQEIAKMGNTGRSTGPHLHFETRNSNNVAFNPLKVLSDGRSKRHPLLQMFQNLWIDKLAPKWEQASIHSSEDLAETRDVLERVLGFRSTGVALPSDIATIDSESGDGLALVGSSVEYASEYISGNFEAFGNRPAVLVRDGNNNTFALEIDLEGGFEK